MRLYIVKHEGKRIACEPMNCNPAFFRSAIQFIREIDVDDTLIHARYSRRADRLIAEKARQGTPIRFRIPAIKKGVKYPFWR